MGDKAKIKINEILLCYCIYYSPLLHSAVTYISIKSALDAVIEVSWVIDTEKV